MARFGDLIEARGKRPLLRERAVPFVAIVDETTKLPLRQFELDQRKDGIGPRLGSNESFDAGLGNSTGARATHAGLRNKVGQELGRDRVRPAQPVFQWLRQASCVGRHGIGTISWRRFRGHGLTRVSARHHKGARWTDALRYKRFITPRSSDLRCSGSRGRARVAPLKLPGEARRCPVGPSVSAMPGLVRYCYDRREGAGKGKGLPHGSLRRLDARSLRLRHYGQASNGEWREQRRGSTLLF
jgi:hypothetical protein